MIFLTNYTIGLFFLLICRFQTDLGTFWQTIIMVDFFNCSIFNFKNLVTRTDGNILLYSYKGSLSAFAVFI